MKNIKEKVNTFVRKYEEGFLKEEIEILLKDFPNINMQKFNDALYGITCMVIEEKIVIYPWDIETALRCGIENRDVNFSEFD